MLPKKLCSGIFHSIKFNSRSTIHHGKTKCYFYARATEYIGISHLTNKRLKNVKQSVISESSTKINMNLP